MSHPNFRTQFFHKEEVGSYDKIALNQRYISVVSQSSEVSGEVKGLKGRGFS